MWRQLTQIKQKVAWLSTVVLQQSLRCLDNPYKHFLRGRERPQFKKKGHRQAITLTKSGFSLKKVYLAKIGGYARLGQDLRPLHPVLLRSSKTVRPDIFCRLWFNSLKRLLRQRHLALALTRVSRCLLPSVMAQLPTALTLNLGTPGLPNSAKSWHAKSKALSVESLLDCGLLSCRARFPA